MQYLYIGTIKQKNVTGVVKHLEPQGFERVTFFVTEGHRTRKILHNLP